MICISPIQPKSWRLAIQPPPKAETSSLWEQIALLYLIIATRRWRFPNKPAPDPCTWCTRSDAGLREDILHCIWVCPILASCWRWGEQLLKRTALNQNAHILLRPQHILIATPLPDEWQILDHFWKILKAILCWQIWKSRNAHFIAGKPADTGKIIRKSWH